jgi:hypothetical protein
MSDTAAVSHTCPDEPHRHHIRFRCYRCFGRGVFALLGQMLERKARRRERIFMQSVELAKANRQFTMDLAKEMGGGMIHDYAVYAEGYYWLLMELHDKGRLPDNWRMNMKTKFPGV